MEIRNPIRTVSKIERVKNLCAGAIVKVDKAIEDHKNGRPADLSESVLKNVKAELQKMGEILKPSVYRPSYPRLVMDWEDKYGLIDYLTEVSYQYSMLKK